MGRIYSIQFNNVSVSAVQDLMSLQSTSGMAISIHEVIVAQVTGSTVANLRLTLKRFSGAYSIGSGGSSVTPGKFNFGDAAATATGRANDTTQTTSGTAVTLRGDVYNVINGYQFLPAPEDRPIIAPSQAFVVSLDSAPGSAETMSGTVVFEELF